MTSIATGRDFRAIARRRLPHFLFEYYDGAAFDGVTARANEAALASVQLRQRVLRDVSHISLETRYWNEPVALPIVLGPVGLAGLAARRGEVQAARAAQNIGIPFTLSSTSVCPLDEVACVTPPWFQLYMVRDRAFVSRMIDWAIGQGCTTLVMTVDLPVLGIRWRDCRSGLTDRGLTGQLRRATQMLARPSWLFGVGLAGRPHVLGNIARFLGGNANLEQCMAWTSSNLEAKLDWSALQFVREKWPGRLIVKGIMDAEDARIAWAEGADGLVISNHGGRQLDGVPSTACALRQIVEKTEAQGPVFVDGGVRSGIDVVRMLALGANGIFLGRSWLFALAAAGETGVARLLSLMAEEMRVSLALLGCTSVGEVNSSNLDGLGMNFQSNFNMR